MKLLIHKQSAAVIRPKKHFDPEHFWAALVCTFLLVLTAEMLYFSWFFVTTTQNLDLPALPTFDTSASKIHDLEKLVGMAEQGILSRTGQPAGTVTGASQNPSPLIQ